MTDYYPAPSWEVFAACKRCGAEERMPCMDMRGVPRGWVPNPASRATVNLRNPHPGRKKLPR